MGKRKTGGHRATLKYPEHVLSPKDLLTFVELDEFTDDWSDLGLNVDEDLLALQVAIMADPTGPDVIQGTGGLRKLRFAPNEWNVGKRQGVRVCYVYFEEDALVLLVLAYGHKEKDNLSREEKQGIRRYIQQIKKYLSTRVYK